MMSVQRDPASPQVLYENFKGYGIKKEIWERLPAYILDLIADEKRKYRYADNPGFSYAITLELFRLGVPRYVVKNFMEAWLQNGKQRRDLEYRMNHTRKHAQNELFEKKTSIRVVRNDVFDVSPRLMNALVVIKKLIIVPGQDTFKITQDEFASILQISRSTMNYYIKALIDKEYIEVVHKGHGRVQSTYRLTEKAEELVEEET